MDTNESEAAQMEANAHQEPHVIKSKDAEAHAVESEAQLHRQGLDDTQNTTGDIHNGEY